MISKWDEGAAEQFEGDLGQLVYAVRLLAQDAELGMYGSGRASVKVKMVNLFHEEEEILYMDGSVEDLTCIHSGDFIGLRIHPLVRLTNLHHLPLDQVMNELACCRILASAPAPPVDSFLHALIPKPFILASEPGALLAVASTPHGRDRLTQIYGESLLILPNDSSPFTLALACKEAVNSHATNDLAGVFIISRGLLSFGQTARQAYERTIDLVTCAEQFLQSNTAWNIPFPETVVTDRPVRQELADLRKKISAIAGYPLILSVHKDPLSLSFCQSPGQAALAWRGPAVSQHAAYTRCLPMIGRDLGEFRMKMIQAYQDQLPEAHLSEKDYAPRIILDPELGLCSLGRTAGEARLAGNLYRRTIDIILRAEALERYQPAHLRESLVVEQQALNTLRPVTMEEGKPFIGEVALVTGGASGIGKACVESLMARGAAVVTLDINPKVKTLFDRPDFLGLECDLTDEAVVLRSFETFTRVFGGLDMLVLNAGIFPAGCRIESLSLEEWQRVMRINLDSNLIVLREAYPLLKLSPKGGRVLVNASKNVLAPGAGAAAYSSSKAAVTQLARVAALEWGKDRIRVNQIHPDAVFDTGIWTEEVLKARAAHYGMTVQQYKTRNVLGVELNSHYIGELVAEMLGPRFEKITGAQIPVDGGSDRVI